MKNEKHSRLKNILYSGLAASILGTNILSTGCASIPRNYSNAPNAPAINGNVSNSGATVGVTFQFYNFHDLGEAISSYGHGFFRPFRKEFWNSCDPESWAAPFYVQNYAKDQRAETAGDDSRYILLIGLAAKLLSGNGGDSDKEQPVYIYPEHKKTSNDDEDDPNPQPTGGYTPGTGGNVGQ